MLRPAHRVGGGTAKGLTLGGDSCAALHPGYYPHRPGLRPLRLHPHFAQQRLQVRSETPGIGKAVNAHAHVQQRYRRAVFRAELAIQPALRRRPRMSPAPAVDSHLLHRRQVKAGLFPQVQRRLDNILHIDLSRKPLNVKAGIHQPPAISQPADGNIPIHLPPEQGGGVAVGRFQSGGAGGIAHLRQHRRLRSHPRGVAGVGGLDHRTGVGGQPPGAGGGDAQSHLRLTGVQPQNLGRRRRAAQRPHQSRRMIGWRGSRSRRRPQASLHFPAQSVSRDNPPPGGLMLLRQRQSRRQAG